MIQQFFWEGLSLYHLFIVFHTEDSCEIHLVKLYLKVRPSGNTIYREDPVSMRLYYLCPVGHCKEQEGIDFVSFTF